MPRLSTHYQNPSNRRQPLCGVYHDGVPRQLTREVARVTCKRCLRDVKKGRLEALAALGEEGLTQGVRQDLGRWV